MQAYKIIESSKFTSLRIVTNKVPASPEIAFIETNDMTE